MRYDVTIDRLPIFTLFDLKGSAKDLGAWAPSLPDFPAMPNTLSRAEGVELYFTGPNRWLLRAGIEQEDALEDSLRPAHAPPEISIVQISDTQTIFRVIGPDAAQVLSIACPLNLHPDTFGANAVSYTEVFGLKSLVIRCEGGFEFAVEQSFGDMIADYLERTIA